MGEAKRRKQLDPNYGKVPNLSHRRSIRKTTLPSNFNPDFGEYLLESLPPLGVKSMHLSAAVSYVLPAYYADMLRGEFTTTLMAGEQKFCATFSFPSISKYQTTQFANQLLEQGIEAEVYPDPKLAYVGNDGQQSVVPVCFVDLDAVRSGLQQNASGKV